MNKMKNQKGLMPILIIALIALVGLGGFFVFQTFLNKPAATPVPLKQKTQPKKTVMVKTRSKTPGIIKQVATAKAIDVKTSLPIQPTNKFTTKDKYVYLSLVLNNPTAGTRIDYVRYINGRYLDHKSVKLASPGMKALAFDWAAKTTANRPVGVYRVRTYTNGILEKRANYTVSKDTSLTFANLMETYYP